MSSSQRDTREPPAAAHFPEAVAQWRLALRTEVKRTSSLPSSMFDACDPMLEMRLAESTEAMLACLHEPSAPVIRDAAGGGEKRVEKVTVDELRTLPQRLAGTEDVDTDLDAGLGNEALAVLADACCSGHEIAAAGAAHMLRALLPFDGASTPQAAAADRLLPLLQRAITGSDAATADLGEVRRRIVELVQRHAAAMPDDGAAQ
jgi:hypothetical protein